jgi:hypothetical protein
MHNDPNCLQGLEVKLTGEANDYVGKVRALSVTGFSHMPEFFA